MLTVINPDAPKSFGTKCHTQHSMTVCKCDCGKVISIMTSKLTRGITISCGCLLGANLKTHGKSGTRLYTIYRNMLNRCKYNTPKNKNYAGRGIKVCEEWKSSFDSFHKWAIGNGYADNLSIDRIDPNGNYEPSNCRWIPMLLQAKNKRNTHNITINGETMCLTDLAKKAGVERSKIYYRLKAGWSLERALSN